MSSIKVKGNINKLDKSFSKGLMTTHIKVKDVLKIYKVDKEVNRDLGYHRLPKIVRYIEAIDTNTGIFFPAIVLSFRQNPLEHYNKEENLLNISRENKLIVIDGQHRIKGIEQFLEKSSIPDEKKEIVLNSYLTVQVYFGLKTQDEKRLFTDINTNAKRVSRSLTTMFDTRDILNIFVRELYNSSDALQAAKVEFNKSRIVRPGNTTFITSVRLRKFVCLILFGKESLSQKNELQIKAQYDELYSFFNKLFYVLFSSLPQNVGDVRKYVLGHEPIQKAIALFLFECIILENENKIKWVETWEEDVEQLGIINWSVKNRDWHPYMMENRKNTPYEYQSFIETTTTDLIEVIKRKLL